MGLDWVLALNSCRWLRSPSSAVTLVITSLMTWLTFPNSAGSSRSPRTFCLNLASLQRECLFLTDLSAADSCRKCLCSFHFFGYMYSDASTPYWFWLLMLVIMITLLRVTAVLETIIFISTSMAIITLISVVIVNIIISSFFICLNFFVTVILFLLLLCYPLLPPSSLLPLFVLHPLFLYAYGCMYIFCFFFL